MLKRMSVVVLLLFVCLFTAGAAIAQANACATHASSLYCLPNSLFGTPQSTPTNQFTPWSPAFSAVGSQLNLLPLASPASGIVLTFNPSLGVYSRSSQSLGPILGERAETVGRHKLFLAVAYQRFTFSSIDGFDLKHLPIVFQVCNMPLTNNGTVCPGTLTVAATTNRLDLKINQFTAFATFGLTDRVDISLVVPVLRTSLGLARETSTILNGVPGDYPPGAVAGSASGIGDVTVRGKGTIWKGERLGLAAGADLRFPTGDELNFLGSGAWGIKPFLSASYRARVTPHADAGYQWNGNSALANPFGVGHTTGNKQLPTNFYYVLGADIAASKKFTIAESRRAGAWGRRQEE